MAAAGSINLKEVIYDAVHRVCPRNARDVFVSPEVQKVCDYFDKNAWAFSPKREAKKRFWIEGREFQITYGMEKGEKRGHAYLNLYEVDKAHALLTRSWGVEVLNPSKTEKFIWKAFRKYFKNHFDVYAIANEASKSPTLQHAYSFLHNDNLNLVADGVVREDIQIAGRDLKVKTGLLRFGKDGLAGFEVYEQGKKGNPIICSSFII